MVFETLPNETKTMKLARASELVDIIMVNGGHHAKTTLPNEMKTMKTATVGGGDMNSIVCISLGRLVRLYKHCRTHVQDKHLCRRKNAKGDERT